ncbi:MAG TPA: hypothetical protein VGI39_15180, partial [Polyangiaceae bacterium]
AFAAPRLALADDRAAATDLFNAGRDLLKQGDYAAGCPKIAESVRLDPTVGALARLAACEEHDQHMVNARALWERAFNLAHSVHDDREADVAAALTRVDRIVPKLVLTAGAPLPEGTVLRIDDLELGPGSAGVSLPVAAGTHTIRVSAAGRKEWSATVETHADGASTTVTIPPLEPLPASAPAAPESAVPPPAADAAPPSPSAPLPPLRIAALATGAGALVGLGIGSGYGISALVLRSQASCQGTVCPDDGSARKLTDAKNSAQISTIAFAAGAGLAAVGIGLWFLAPKASDRTALYLAPVMGGAVVGGVF